ncbi:hypothetical protein [Nevskia soli]|uniref:hypothetical protein n=1 Tax=Nevskia soli TaxID=418856 RepID=UPI0012FCAA27|nr:hypothetical protein [Nevskia soli]
MSLELNSEGSNIGRPESKKKISANRISFISLMLGFLALWLAFFILYRTFPYLSSGSSVVYRAKIQREMNGEVFPEDTDLERILIFGDSKVLAGFVPDLFDNLASSDGIRLTSYNSGYPGLTTFVPELTGMIKHGQVPNVLLLTSPWKAGSQHFNPFKMVENDHDMAEDLFPFRYLIRDTFSFLITSREHGGPWRFYRECRDNVRKMVRDRGYYFISEQSHFTGNSLPDNFKLPSDQPDRIRSRNGDSEADELHELNQLIVQNGIHCYYVPSYLRQGEAAQPPAVDEAFAQLLRNHSKCNLLGPDYFIYPNKIFSDEAHLNPEGARIYTESLYQLLSSSLHRDR